MALDATLVPSFFLKRLDAERLGLSEEEKRMFVDELDQKLDDFARGFRDILDFMCQDDVRLVGDIIALKRENAILRSENDSFKIERGLKRKQREPVKAEEFTEKKARKNHQKKPNKKKARSNESDEEEEDILNGDVIEDDYL